MKKILALGAGLLGSVAAFAEETGGSGPDFDAATTALTSVSTALQSWVGDAVPILGAIAAAFLIFWLGKMVFRLVKGWASSAK